MKTITDASIFEFPLSRWLTPVSQLDLLQQVRQALASKQSITLRAGGTSLGGQAIGSGVVLDVSKHLTHILSFSPDKREVVVEPGVIQEDLNRFVAAEGLRFAPDTSTANRAMIGGMIGNNSCGAYSIYYGTTREHVKSMEVILADGSEAIFEPLSAEALQQKLSLSNLEGDIYRQVIQLLEAYGEKIVRAFPHPSIKRRNTGYALDELYRHYQPFNPNGKPFNLAPLICGSEGTLAVVKTATLNLVPLPRYRQLLCPHFDSVEAALQTVPAVLAFEPAAIELIDQATLACTKHNRDQSQNRFWIEGNPGAVLVVELFEDSAERLSRRIEALRDWFVQQGAGACPIIEAEEAAKVWAVRKAGLGLLMGKPTRKKAVAVIEDAAVPVFALADYFRDVQALMTELGVGCVYYGHASVGLIHIRPELDLAEPEDRDLMVQIAQRNAALIQKYRGAISGEHGDGRIRAPFLPQLLGEEVYGCLVKLKHIFDPEGLLNPGVIIGEMPITHHLRADRRPVAAFEALLPPALDWSADLSLMDAVEKCNGAGACRKSTGLMCPSYQVTREEAFSTRGRSQLLRYALTEPDPRAALQDEELQQALDLCLGCKGCKSQCPASVDMAKLKSEVWYQLKQGSVSFQRRFQDWVIRHYGRLMQWGSLWPQGYNWLQSWGWVKSVLRVDRRRTLPHLADQTAREIWQSFSLNSAALAEKQSVSADSLPQLWVLVDLYAGYQEPQIVKACFEVLQKLGVSFQPIFMTTSPRALISQGLLQEAKQALRQLAAQVRACPQAEVLGLEPSEISVMMDELGDLFPEWKQFQAKKAAKKAQKLQNPQPRLPGRLDKEANEWEDEYTGLGILAKTQPFESWLLQFLAKKPEVKRFFVQKPFKRVWLHVHCHQKSLMSPQQVEQALRLIADQVKVIASGCCGMSGAFGYQHYEVSVKIAQQALLPAVEEMAEDEVLVATGTSCRHQVADLSQKRALHLVEAFALAGFCLSSHS